MGVGKEAYTKFKFVVPKIELRVSDDRHTLPFFTRISLQKLEVLIRLEY